MFIVPSGIWTDGVSPRDGQLPWAGENMTEKSKKADIRRQNMNIETRQGLYELISGGQRMHWKDNITDEELAQMRGW